MRRLADTHPDSASLRLDKWLWFARFARTRSMATKLCLDGRVEVGGTLAAKPHHQVRIGDRIALTQGRARRRLTVAALGERRGPAIEARRLYDEPEAPMPVPEAAWSPLLDEESWA
jgi:ribosome-associated heat shock protein Hsp15